jgi:glycosyltransferase involved in cell wall biosynthesis
LKVLHIIDTLDVGGAERVAVTLANTFILRGHTVSVLILLKSKNELLSELDSNIQIYYLNRKNKYNPFYSIIINNIILKHNIIHVHMRYNYRYLFFISIFCSFKWNNIYLHDHYGNIDNQKKINFISKQIFLKSNYIGVSDQLCKWANNIGIKKINILENIIIGQKKVENKSNKIIKFLLVSNFHPRKNIEFALKIISEINKDKECSLDIIGKISNRKYYNRIKKQILDLDLSRSINIFHDCNNVQNIACEYDIALHTSKSETGPLVLIEYLAQNLPFLTYSTGDVANKCSSSLPFFIIDNFNIKEWKMKINKILNYDKNKINKAMENLFENNFSLEVYYNKCLKIYQKNIL